MTVEAQCERSPAKNVATEENLKGTAAAGANSMTCMPDTMKPAFPNGSRRSTRYTLTGTECVADVIGRMPSGCSPTVWATLGEMHVADAPVSMSAGNVVIWAGVVDAGASTPGCSTPTLMSGPVLVLVLNLPLRHGM